jgi:hypothetical protein
MLTCKYMSKFIQASFQGLKTIPLLKGIASPIDVSLQQDFAKDFRVKGSEIISPSNKGLFRVEVSVTLKCMEEERQDLSLCIKLNQEILSCKATDSVCSDFKTIRYSELVNLDKKDRIKAMIVNSTNAAGVNIYNLSILITEM